MSESTLEESETEQEPDSEEQPDKTSFSWSEYEEVVTPSSEPEEVLGESTPSEPEPQDYDVGVSEDEEISTSVEEATLHEEPPDPPKVWSPYDEPSIPEDDVTEEETETEVDDETEPLDEGDGETVITEPPPPPPPESEEDEEERKRRARRLFFGA